MKISIMVEGASDKEILEKQNTFFNSLGLEVKIQPMGGKKNMIKKARNHYNIAKLSGASHIIFLPDLDRDECALVTRKLVGMDDAKDSVVIVIKRELEAWLLADWRCIETLLGAGHRPAGQTDAEHDPKQKMYSIFRKKFRYNPTETELAKFVSQHFSIDRASHNNTSVKRFKEFLENIASRQ
jgi:hypothetical protein